MYGAILARERVMGAWRSGRTQKSAATGPATAQA
jgi:hypothetical protein